MVATLFAILISTMCIGMIFVVILGTIYAASALIKEITKIWRKMRK